MNKLEHAPQKIEKKEKKNKTVENHRSKLSIFFAKVVSYLKHLGLIFVILLLLFFVMKYWNKADDISPFFTIHYTLATLLVWFSLYLILKGFTSKSFLSLSLVVVAELIFDLINYIVLRIRGSAVTISDLVALPTALSISQNLTIEFEKKGIIGIILAIILLSTLILFRNQFLKQKEKWCSRSIKVVLGLSFLIVLSFTSIYKGYSIWDINATYRTLGSPLTIMRMAQDIRVKKPQGYQKNKVKELLASQTPSLSVISQKDLPNIIVIINESFCDYYHLYQEGYADPIEYFTQLSQSENVISGVMYSSSFGGQTSNIEYEFLTQNSIRILPVGSYMFQQYISKPVSSSLVTHLKNHGYTASAIHPWESFAYSRNKIYPFLGFDTIKFRSDIEGLEANFNNDFPTDQSTYQEVLRQIQSKKSNEKLFAYVLTVQNHTSFENPDPNQITYHDETNKNVYMQLIHESSESLKDFIQKLSSYDEKYLLLFFGDHQPNLDELDNLAERDYLQYEVPFLIWANYPIEGQHGIKTSTIFLQNYLLNAAGIEYNQMNQYIDSLSKEYPIITPMFCMNANDKILSTDEVKDNSKLLEYNQIDYYRIFDSP